jgi:ribosomal protein L34
MKLRIRQSNKKRVRKVGFLRRNKTTKGKKIIARQRKRYGAYRGAFRK